MTARTALAFSLLLGIALGSARAATSATASLYDRLGGKPAVTAVVDDFANRLVADPETKKWFFHAAEAPEALASYKSKLTDFVCVATGGACQYTGLDMVTAHKDRRITGDAFDRVVNHLVATLDKLKVPDKEKSDLLALLAPLKKVIVETKQ